MCITVAPTTLCTQVMDICAFGWSSVAMQPPLAVLPVGGTSWSPRRSKTNVWENAGIAQASTATRTTDFVCMGPFAI